MPFFFTMPKLSPTMEEGTVAKWHKKEGEYVAPGELLVEITTDKATVEQSPLDGGYVRKILVRERESAPLNAPLAVLAERQEEEIESLLATLVPAKKPTVEEVAMEKKAEPSAEMPPVARVAAAFVPEPPLEGYLFPHHRGAAQERIAASPLARKLAEERGLDLSTIRGSGPRGRITKRDLERATAKRGPERNRLPEDAPGSFEEVPLTPMRKAIARRLQEAKATIPHFYVEMTVDAEALHALYSQLKESQLQISLNDLLIRATALALREQPQLNAGFYTEHNALIAFKTIDISIAVSLPEGLITPIVRHADYKSLEEIAVEVRLLAQRAREGKLQPHEYQGGSFCISNLGMFGVTAFSAILNPPQAAILAVGALRDEAVVKEGKVCAGKRLTLTLSADHRVVDGAAAASFLKLIRELLERPALLLL